MVTCLNRVGRDGKEEAGMTKKTESLTVVWRLHQTVTGRKLPTRASVVCVSHLFFVLTSEVSFGKGVSG